jgi:hypothetical protein
VPRMGTVPSNDSSNEPWSQRKDFGLKKKHYPAGAWRSVS